MSPERERKSPRAVSMCELMFYNNNLKGKGERRQVMKLRVYPKEYRNRADL